jgi:hypothetical protein
MTLYYTILIMFTKDGFYPVEVFYEMSLEQQAAKHGELNEHVVRVEDMDGKVLWTRQIQ